MKGNAVQIKEIPKESKLRKSYRYEVDGRPLGQKRRRFKHGALEDAEQYLKEITSNADEVGASERKHLTPEVLKDAVRGVQLLKNYEGESLLSAVEFYVKHLEEEAKRDKTVISIVALKRLKKMKDEGKTRNHINKTRAIWDKLEKSFEDVAISSLLSEDLQFWIESFEFGSTTTMANYRTALNTLFNYAVEMGILDKNPVSLIAKYERHPSTGFLTPEQVENLLSHCDAEIIPAITICFFCGVRPDYINGEISRLDWKDIRLSKGKIRLDGRKTKTKELRTVDIPDNLKAWLKPYYKNAGLVVEHTGRFRRLWEQARKDAGLWGENWAHDATRNSFSTYHIELYGDEHKTATQTGHSDIKTLRNNYKDLADKEDAEAYFNIYPKEKIVSIKNSA